MNCYIALVPLVLVLSTHCAVHDALFGMRDRKASRPRTSEQEMSSRENVSEDCITQYNQLERSLFKEPLNVDSLIRTLFPPNEQRISVAEMFYYTTDNFSVHPSQLELTGEVDAETLDECANYKFRWTRSPIFLFMNPYLMDTLSLFTVRVNVHKARLLIDPICTQYSNYTVKGTPVPLPEYYLDYMTTKIKIYALRREITVQEGFDSVESYQGYSSFYNDSVNDFSVLIYSTTYRENLYILVVALVCLVSFVAVAFPVFISLKYKMIHRYALDSTLNFSDLLWACVIVSFVAVCLILIVDVYYILITQLTNDPPEKWAYYLGIILLLIFLFVNLAIAISIGYKFKSDFPIPYVLKILCCCTCNSKKGSVVAQILAVWIFLDASQLLAFHATFIFFGFVASPIQAASNILLYLTTLFFTATVIALFFSTIKDTRNKVSGRFFVQKAGLMLVFILLFTFSVLLAFCFLRLTIYVGDAESGGIPGLFSSLAPSLLLAGLGFVAKRMLEKHSLMKHFSEDEENNDIVFPKADEVVPVELTDLAASEQEEK